MGKSVEQLRKELEELKEKKKLEEEIKALKKKPGKSPKLASFGSRVKHSIDRAARNW